ncbi:unnamed protein product [Urochloa humidicola]
MFQLLALKLKKSEGTEPSSAEPVDLKDPGNILEGSMDLEHKITTLEVELAEHKKRNSELQVKYDASEAARLKSFKDHNEAMDRIMRNIDSAVDIDAIKAKHDSEIKSLKERIQNLEVDLMETQADRASWKTGMFQVTEENERLRRSLKSLQGSYNAVKADYEAAVKQYEELETAATTIVYSIALIPAGARP